MRRVALVLLFSLFVATPALASYTAQYSSYTAWSGDETYIYQTVIIQGTTTGDCFYTC
jgi:hypothetical protein